jgi:hypothetical protein
MAAFVGYIVQSNGIHFPWALTTSGVSYGDISAAGSPPDQWDALPTASKVQILLFIGARPYPVLCRCVCGVVCEQRDQRRRSLAAASDATGGEACRSLAFGRVGVRLSRGAREALMEHPVETCVPVDGRLTGVACWPDACAGFLEIMSESTYVLEQSGNKHYMKGGVPGKFPSLKGVMPHPVPFDLFDPFGLSKNASPEKKARGLQMEINNGRLAQIGIMGFLAEQKVPGSVPALSGMVPSYSGEVMAPFSAGDAGLPFVQDMLTYKMF